MSSPNLNDIETGTFDDSEGFQHLKHQISFWQAFVFWLKLGFISFGGPAGQIAIMHQELVEKRCWISEKRFLHALNFCMVLPGPEAQQLATYLGWLMHKTRGGLLAGLLFILPSFFLLIALSALYVTFGQLYWAQAALLGIKPAVTAIVLQAAWRIGSKTLKTPVLAVVALFSFGAVRIFDLGFPLIVLLSALLGWWLGRYYPQSVEITSTHNSTNFHSQKAIIDDETPTPAHAIFKTSSFIRVALIGGLFWLIPIALLYAKWGLEHPLSQMAWFFTKAALLTFGGAYAVLPYVYHAAVGEFGWLNAAQMMDGLALGETTPGPLIMIVTYVGFIGGYIKAFWGVDHVMMSAIMAALCVTYFTFLPSFIFIFLGGLIIEGARAQVRFNHILATITASVVGVIVNLGLFFAFQVLWTQELIFNDLSSWFTAVDIKATCIFALALLSLLKLKRSVIEVIVVSIFLGELTQLIF